MSWILRRAKGNMILSFHMSVEWGNIQSYWCLWITWLYVNMYQVQLYRFITKIGLINCFLLWKNDDLIILVIGLKDLFYYVAVRSLLISYKFIYFGLQICQVDEHYDSVTKCVMMVWYGLSKFLKIKLWIW